MNHDEDAEWEAEHLRRSHEMLMTPSKGQRSVPTRPQEWTIPGVLSDLEASMERVLESLSKLEDRATYVVRREPTEGEEDRMAMATKGDWEEGLSPHAARLIMTVARMDSIERRISSLSRRLDV